MTEPSVRWGGGGKEEATHTPVPSSPAIPYPPNLP